MVGLIDFNGSWKIGYELSVISHISKRSEKRVHDSSPLPDEGFLRVPETLVVGDMESLDTSLVLVVLVLRCETACGSGLRAVGSTVFDFLGWEEAFVVDDERLREAAEAGADSCIFHTDADLRVLALYINMLVS